MKKQILAVVLSAAMTAGMGSVSVLAADDKADDKTYNIGICQLVQHEALDAATQGFKDAITEELGDKVTFDEQNAQGDSNTCSTIINGFVSNNVDLILANATASLQAAAAGTNEIPLMAAIMTVTIILSAVSSNTGTVACLMPVIIGICSVAKLPASKQLMPLAIAANVGGTITMIGTPPNVIVTGALTTAGLPTFGFFEFAWIGIPLSLVITIYTLFIGRHMIAAKSAGAMDEEALKAAKEEAGASDDDAPKSKTKMWISGLILIGVVLCMALDLKTVPLHTAAVTGAILCVVTGCLKEKEAYAGIDWVTIFLFAGMLSVASAMEKTGAGKLIADTVVSMMGTNPNPYVLTAVLFLISNVLTQFMSNTASAALLAPIGISIAQSIGADPKPVLMALGIAASCAFATPMATPPNTLVLGPGGFSFNDYAKVGVPMCLLSLVICLVVIPIVWPFGM